MTALSRVWNRLWFTPYDPLPAALFRISFGAILTLVYLALFPNWARYFGANGVLSINQKLFDDSSDAWSLFHWFPALPFLSFWVLGLAAAIGFTVGWHTRLCCIMLFILEQAMINRNRFAINGEDLVGRMLLFYGCFAPLGRTLSVDALLARRRGRAASGGTPQIWPVRLMQINFAAIYAFSLPVKLMDESWRSGEAVYLSLASNMWGRLTWVQPFYGWLGVTMTWLSILAEALFPVFVWHHRTRPYMLAAAAALHVGIAVMLKNVTFFSLCMVCGLCLFPSAAEMRAWAGRLVDVWHRYIRRAA
jgi:hypothetical protein